MQTALERKQYLAHYRQQEYVKLRRRMLYQRPRDPVAQIKEDTPCADCGQQYPHYVMDFDHVRGEKLFKVSDRRPLAERLEEIAKCDVVCSNCHRERTHQRRRGVPGIERFVKDSGYFNRTKTHCKRGHEFTEENTRWRLENNKVKRACRTCSRMYVDAYRARQRDGVEF